MGAREAMKTAAQAGQKWSLRLELFKLTAGRLSEFPIGENWIEMARKEFYEELGAHCTGPAGESSGPRQGSDD